jgi:D-glycero-D-manno-heptose 1,7-bisphosphate phosphatase
MQRKAIFLDRDGVLNSAIIRDGKPYPPASLSELHIPDDVPLALSELKSAGFMLIGATNQPDVARGTTPRTLVEAINTEIMKTCPLDEIRVCYHDDADACKCRKPLPGLLFDAAYDYVIDLKQSIMIGDRWKDIEAGQRAGCKTIWLNQQYSEKAPKNAPDFIAKNLKEAAEWIINNKGAVT